MKSQSQSLPKNRRFRDMTEGEAKLLVNSIQRKIEKLLPPGSEFALVVSDGPIRREARCSRRDHDLIEEIEDLVDWMKTAIRGVGSNGERNRGGSSRE